MVFSRQEQDRSVTKILRCTKSRQRASSILTKMLIQDSMGVMIRIMLASC